VSLGEAAKVDGAGIFTIFYKIILPLSTPIIATVAIWVAVAQWNSFYDTLLYNVNLGMNKYNTLQYILYKYVSKTNMLLAEIRANSHVNPDDIQKLMNPTTVQMTVAMIVTLPVLFVYPVFQKYFTKGIMLGAVKG
jgi:multiple sugar transport system permease protein/putative aldouronate transport system permease protein